MAINWTMVWYQCPIWKGFEQQAMGFGIAADKLQHEITVLAQSKSGDDVRISTAAYTISVAVLRGLATECALKAVVRRSTGDHLRIHDLAKLYEDLPVDVTSMMENLVQDQGILPLEILKRHRNDFVDWRYPSPEPVINNLHDLQKVLRLLIWTLHHEDFIALCPQDDNGGSPPPADQVPE